MNTSGESPLLRYNAKKYGEYLYIEFNKRPPGKVKDALKEIGFVFDFRYRAWKSKSKKAQKEGVLIADAAVKEAIRKKQQRGMTLCWGCANCYNGCSWSRKFEPVDGWKAIPTSKGVTYGDRKKEVKSFFVVECPEFVKG